MRVVVEHRGPGMSARRSDAVEGLAEDLFAYDIVSGGWVPRDEVDHGGAIIRLTHLLAESSSLPR